MNNKLFLTGVLLTAGLRLTALSETSPSTMSVQVRKGELRASPSFLGTVVATVEYGDPLTVAEAKGPWRKVSNAAGTATGWIHESALTTKKVVLKAGDKNADVAASSGELALAGKGFNSKVEAEFKSRNKDIDFTWVDRMETFKVPLKEKQEFLKDGKVEPKGGAK